MRWTSLNGKRTTCLYSALTTLPWELPVSNRINPETNLDWTVRPVVWKPRATIPQPFHPVCFSVLQFSAFYGCSVCSSLSVPCDIPVFRRWRHDWRFGYRLLCRRGRTWPFPGEQFKCFFSDASIEPLKMPTITWNTFMLEKKEIIPSVKFSTIVRKN